MINLAKEVKTKLRPPQLGWELNGCPFSYGLGRGIIVIIFIIRRRGRV